jgi:hypothetical protein
VLYSRRQLIDEGEGNAPSVHVYQGGSYYLSRGHDALCAL